MWPWWPLHTRSISDNILLSDLPPTCRTSVFLTIGVQSWQFRLHLYERFATNMSQLCHLVNQSANVKCFTPSHCLICHQHAAILSPWRSLRNRKIFELILLCDLPPYAAQKSSLRSLRTQKIFVLISLCELSPTCRTWAYWQPVRHRNILKTSYFTICL